MSLPRLLRTVRHLKPGQIAYRLYWPVKRRRIGKPPAISLRPAMNEWRVPVPKRPEMTRPRKFRILNQDIDVHEAAAWNDPNRDKLLLYHLHYMDELTAGNAECRTDWHAQLMDQWIDENPPLDGNGWEPYPLSLRIVNWIKWQLAGNELTAKRLESLWTQSHVLSQSIEYHLQANHLLANAKGLIFAGVFFAGSEADRWQATARRIFERQITEQVLPDGGHFERSPMYQAVLIEDFLDVLNLCRTYGLNRPAGIQDAAARMLAWLGCLTHPDGEPAYFNDCVAGNTATLGELLAYAERLDLAADSGVGTGSRWLVDSGYFRFDTAGLTTIADAGHIGPDFQPGHAHCDCLSFELSIGEQRVFVNTGVSTYNDNERRHRERSTAAHNTVSLPGHEQSEIWGAFRVGRRARPFGVDARANSLQAAHDGYEHLGIVHRRRFDIRSDGLDIADELEANRTATGTAHFHVHPDFTPVSDGDEVAFGGVRMHFANARQIDLLPYEYCLGFNDRRDGVKVSVTFDSTLTTRIRHEDTLHIR